MGVKTVAIYADADRLSLHRVKADESYKGPLEAYLSINEIVRVARGACNNLSSPNLHLLLRPYPSVGRRAERKLASSRRTR
jgi:pyruvate carboxylase